MKIIVIRDRALDPLRLDINHVLILSAKTIHIVITLGCNITRWLNFDKITTTCVVRVIKKKQRKLCPSFVQNPKYQTCFYCISDTYQSIFAK
ncbi:hypothetical protein HanPSC8_Chr04g0179341 [Helianthus annuus]|nr:hypothetical protein HanPSC8_Chr04g0179341 [Helianthus annuus]